MLTFRTEQLEAMLAESGRRAKVAHLVKLAERAWPEQVRALTEDGTSPLGPVIQEAFERAARAGFQDPRNADRFVRLMLQTGCRDFEESCAWAVTILGWDADERLKIAALEKRAALEASSGPAAAVSPESPGGPHGHG